MSGDILDLIHGCPRCAARWREVVDDEADRQAGATGEQMADEVRAFHDRGHTYLAPAPLA